MKRKYWIILGVFGFLFLVLLLKSIGEEAHHPYNLEKDFLKGVSLSPRSFVGEDFTNFFGEASQVGDVVMWAGDWAQLKDMKVIPELAEDYDYMPLMEVGHYVQETGKLIRPFTEENKQMYLEDTLEFIEEYDLKYFGIGVEVNVFAKKNPEDFEEFVIFYNEVYEEIKKVSLETKVFTVFQLETMKGSDMWGLEENEPSWEMIDLFKSDVVGFTTYPGLFYKDVSDIPQDHYSEIKLHTSKPIVFTEIGWHSEAFPEGWESSEEEQAEFVEKFFEWTKDLNKEIVIWSFLYDPDTIKPFDSMGLINSDGEKKEAWVVWEHGE